MVTFFRFIVAELMRARRFLHCCTNWKPIDANEISSRHQGTYDHPYRLSRIGKGDSSRQREGVPDMHRVSVLA